MCVCLRVSACVCVCVCVFCVGCCLFLEGCIRDGGAFLSHLCDDLTGSRLEPGLTTTTTAIYIRQYSSGATTLCVGDEKHRILTGGGVRGTLTASGDCSCYMVEVRGWMPLVYYCPAGEAEGGLSHVLQQITTTAAVLVVFLTIHRRCVCGIGDYLCSTRSCGYIHREQAKRNGHRNPYYPVVEMNGRRAASLTPRRLVYYCVHNS